MSVRDVFPKFLKFVAALSSCTVAGFPCLQALFAVKGQSLCYTEQLLVHMNKRVSVCAISNLQLLLLCVNTLKFQQTTSCEVYLQLLYIQLNLLNHAQLQDSRDYRLYFKSRASLYATENSQQYTGTNIVSVLAINNLQLLWISS